MLGPFTDTWDDLVNDNGDPLRFGMMHYTNATSTFRERVKPQDVKTALVLLNHLFLEHHTVENSLLVDSSMLLIKASSEGAGVHFNSIGKPNRMFAWFVIDYLSMCILVDTFIEHRSLVAPMPFTNNPMSEEGHCRRPRCAAAIAAALAAAPPSPPPSPRRHCRRPRRAAAIAAAPPPLPPPSPRRRHRPRRGAAIAALA